MKSLIKFILLILFFTPLSRAKPILINGAGATFPYILYSKWFNEYAKINTSARINYRSIGSGGGIRQLINGTLDFGASDVPMNPSEIGKNQRSIVHVPTTLSAVVLTYNLPDLKDKILLMTPKIIGQIFEGTIKKWNDPQILSINTNLPSLDQDIVVVYRADGSGTTAVFTEYLSKAYPQWKIGKGKSINWPVGIGGKGNEGVMGLVQKINGSFAYVAMSYALNRKLPTVHVKNQKGRFIKASMNSVQSAAQTSMKEKKSYIESIVHSKGLNDYPISSFTYLLVYKEMTQKTGKIIVDFLKWALEEGQNYSSKLHYVPLPKSVIEKAKVEIKKIKIQDDPSLEKKN